MKNTIIRLICILLVSVVLFTGCSLFQKEAQAIISNEFGLDISDAKVNLLINTRKDGSKGGIAYIDAEFLDENFASQLQNNSRFKSLPFSPELAKILNQIDLLKDENGKLRIPIADNGYYCIELKLNKETDSVVPQGADLIVAIYDGNTHKFNFCHAGIDNLNILADLQNLIPAA